MRRFRRCYRTFCVILAAFLTSCVTVQSAYQYQEPKPISTSNEVVINRPFSEVWDVLVGNLAKSFFVINNVEKESRIINVSFLTDTPESYIDCGRSHRTTQVGEESKSYDYAVAESSSFMYVTKWGIYKNLPAEILIKRQTSLDGRINIYVAPRGEKTVITANARYVLTVRSAGNIRYLNAFNGLVKSEPYPLESVTITFSTNQPGSADWGSAGQSRTIRCYSTGKLETETLNLVKPAQ